MKIQQLMNEMATTSGSVASVSKPLGEVEKRTPVKGLQPAEKVMSGKTKKKGPYANSIVEGKMKDLSMDLSKNGMSDEAFKKKYGKSKEEMRKALKEKPPQDQKTKDKVQEAKLDEEDLILVPGQTISRKNGFIPHGKSRVDHEIEMAKSDLYQIVKNAKSAFDCIKDKSEDEGLEGWVQEKIIKAADYLNTIAEYLESKKLPEGLKGAIAGGALGGIITKTPQGIITGANIGDQLQDMFNSKMAEGVIAAGGVGEGVAEGSNSAQEELKTINSQLKAALKDYKTNHQMHPNTYKEKIEKLKSRREELIAKLKQGVMEGEFDQWGGIVKIPGPRKKYEMMLPNGRVKKFVAGSDKEAKSIAKGYNAKSVISLKGDVPAGPVKEQGVAEGTLNEFSIGGFNGGDGSNDLQLYLSVAKKLNMKKYKPSTAHALIAKKMAELVDAVDDEKVDWARHMARKAQGLPNMMDQQGVAEGQGDVVQVHQHQRGKDMGKYGTFNIERETPTIIVVYDHSTGEMLKFNRATGRGIGPASQLMIKQGVAESNLKEIGFAASLDDANYSTDKLLKIGKLYDTIEGNKVMTASSGPEKVYFLVVNDQVTALLGFKNNHLKNIKNFTKTSGVVRALIGCLVHKHGKKIIIHNDEPLTPDGKKWILHLIQSPRGLNIVDQNGKQIDSSSLNQEWLEARKSSKLGPTSIIISENSEFGNKLRENESLRESNSLLMPYRFYNTKFKKQGVAEEAKNKPDFVTQLKPGQKIPRGYEMTAHGRLVKKPPGPDQSNQGVGGLGSGRKYGVAEGNLKEIGYSNELGDLSVSHEKIIADATKDGTISQKPVMKYVKGNTTLFFFTEDNKISALVLLNNGKILKAIKNFSGPTGQVYALMNYIVNINDTKLLITPDEPLTKEGFTWIAKLIKNPSGLKITDLNGNSIDIDQLRDEWHKSKLTLGDDSGSTGIIISESSQKWKNKLQENESSLMPYIFYNVKSKKKGMAEGSTTE
jgi:hypothetical protein